MFFHPVSYEKLIAFAAGELGGPDALFIAAHLAHCTKCSGTVRLFRTVRSILKDDITEAPPPDTTARAVEIFARAGNHISRARHLPIQHVTPAPTAHSFSPTRTLAALVLAVLLFFSGAGLVVARAQGTLPGDRLYPLKTTIENVRLTLAMDETTRAEIHLDIAHLRVGEISTLLNQGRYDTVPQAIQAYEQNIKKAADNLDAVSQHDAAVAAGLARQVDLALDQYDGELRTLSKFAPAEVRPAIERAVTISNNQRSQVHQQIQNVPAAAPTVSPPQPTQTPRPVAPIVAPSPTPGQPVPTPVPPPPATAVPPSPVPPPSTEAPMPPATSAPLVPAAPPSPMLLPATEMPLPTVTALPVAPTATMFSPTAITIPHLPTPVQPPTATAIPTTATVPPVVDATLTLTPIEPTVTPQTPPTGSETPFAPAVAPMMQTTPTAGPASTLPSGLVQPLPTATPSGTAAPPSGNEGNTI